MGKICIVSVEGQLIGNKKVHQNATAKGHRKTDQHKRSGQFSVDKMPENISNFFHNHIF
jgi:hypothetical protein